MQPIEFDVTKTLDKYNKLSSSIPYIISKAQNSLSYEKGRSSLSMHLNSRLDIKAKAMKNKTAIKFTRSKKTDLTSTMYFHLGKQSDTTNQLNKMMSLQQDGGTERAKTKKLAIPHRGNMARYGGLPRKKPLTKRSALSINKVMEKADNNKKIKGHSIIVKSNGVFLGVGKTLKLLYTFIEKAEHNKKLIDFQKAVEIVYNKNFDRYFQREFLRELKKG